jgi:hypothetical protein
MNSMTMAAHQVEEYVEPGDFPGQVNAGMFKSDQPLNYPFNPKSAALTNLRVCKTARPLPIKRCCGRQPDVPVPSKT